MDHLTLLHTIRSERERYPQRPHPLLLSATLDQRASELTAELLSGRQRPLQPELNCHIKPR